MNNTSENTETIELNELQNFREQKFTTEDVAERMKVGKTFIAYIESGEFEKLGAPTFVRGHLTNYCKVVGVDVSSILAQIPSQLLQHQELQSSNAKGGSPLSHVRRQSNHFGRYAVGTLLLGMLGMSFYFIWDKWTVSELNAVGTDMRISQATADEVETKKITYSSMIPQVTGPQIPTATVVDENATDSEAIVNPLGEEDAAVNEGTEDDSDEVSNSTNPSTINTDNDTSAASQEISTDNSMNTDVNAGYSIVMSFDEQAWVSIKTLSGESVVQDLLGPGKREFYVQEPVRFRIGNAQKMQLSINDDDIELAPLTVKDVANFQWPNTQVNQSDS